MDTRYDDDIHTDADIDDTSTFQPGVRNEPCYRNRDRATSTGAGAHLVERARQPGRQNRWQAGHR